MGAVSPPPVQLGGRWQILPLMAIRMRFFLLAGMRGQGRQPLTERSEAVREVGGTPKRACPRAGVRGRAAALDTCVGGTCLAAGKRGTVGSLGSAGSQPQPRRANYLLKPALTKASVASGSLRSWGTANKPTAKQGLERAQTFRKKLFCETNGALRSEPEFAPPGNSQQNQLAHQQTRACRAGRGVPVDKGAEVQGPPCDGAPGQPQQHRSSCSRSGSRCIECRSFGYVLFRWTIVFFGVVFSLTVLLLYHPLHPSAPRR